MRDHSQHLRSVVDALLSWTSLCYGLYATAILPVQQDEDALIAVGIGVILVALIGFTWSGNRRRLGLALLVVGVAAPFVTFATAPLSYSGRIAVFGEAFWTSMALGTAVGIPLVVLAVVLMRSPPGPSPADPWWFALLRWAMQAGVLLMVNAFRAGDWDSGIPLVYGGLAIALFALLFLAHRRLSVPLRTIGVLFLALGLSGSAIVLVTAALVGSHMDGEELAIGLLPAVAVAVLGWLLYRAAPRASRAGAPRRRTAEADHPGADNATEVTLDMTLGPDH